MSAEETLRERLLRAERTGAVVQITGHAEAGIYDAAPGDPIDMSRVTATPPRPNAICDLDLHELRAAVVGAAVAWRQVTDPDSAVAWDATYALRDAVDAYLVAVDL